MSFPTALATTARYVGTAAFVTDNSSVGFTEPDSHFGVETDGQEQLAARSQPGLPSTSEYLTDGHDCTYEMPTSSPSAHQQQQHPAAGSRYALSNISDHTEVSHATLQQQLQQQRQAQRQQMQPHQHHAAGSHMAYSEASPAPSVASDTGHASAINANLAAASAAAAVAAAVSLKEKEMAIWNALTDEEKKLATILFKKHGLSGQDGGAH